MTTIDVNGALVFTEEGVGNSRVALYAMLNRGMNESAIRTAIHNAKPEEMEDFFVMAFQTRDIRGGKGERDLFYVMIEALYMCDTTTATAMIPHIPEYGRWSDLWELMVHIPFKGFQTAVLEHVKRTLEADEAGPTHSLLAKWLPREKAKSYPGVARKIVAYLYPGLCPKTAMKLYRKRIANLNRLLKTTEIHMCEGNWSAIEPSHVPGRSLMMHRAAFLNKKVNTETIRHPHDEDRMKCRENFLAFFESPNKGKDVVFPHEIARKIMSCDAEEQKLLSAQWEGIREAAKELGGLRSILPMCDFSGSMGGTPYWIAMALGILISEVNMPAFRNRILTFDSTPQWALFGDEDSLVRKIEKACKNGQGLSTNFYAACRLILHHLESARVPVGEEPTDLLVLTDMGWDAASNGVEQETILRRVTREFKEASDRVWGTGCGWKVPRIIVWNLRAEYKVCQASAKEEGILQISGWSPSALKSLQRNGVQTKTSWEALRALLDDVRYTPVRETFRLFSV